MPYDQASKLVALNEYLETIGISDIKVLPYGSGKPPADDPQVFVSSVGLDFGLPQLDKSAHGLGDGYPKSPTSPTAETPLEALVNLLNLFPMVWHGDIIENSKISADYAEWNSAHPFGIRQNHESFVLYTDDPNDCGTAYHACDLQVAILHNRLLHNPDRDINYNPAVYPKLVEHLNHYDAVRWAVYHPGDDCRALTYFVRSSNANGRRMVWKLVGLRSKLVSCRIRCTRRGISSDGRVRGRGQSLDYVWPDLEVHPVEAAQNDESYP
jgi:hypothetical protein